MNSWKNKRMHGNDFKNIHEHFLIIISAYNHRNKTVDVYSDGVIYDNSPPTVGIIQIESRLLYYVTSYEISVQWNEVEDNESGIRKIEIGIGSSNRSADIIPFQEFENYGLINTNQYIQDGHRYFAILKVFTKSFLFFYTHLSTSQLMDFSKICIYFLNM